MLSRKGAESGTSHWHGGESIGNPCIVCILNRSCSYLTFSTDFYADASETMRFPLFLKQLGTRAAGAVGGGFLIGREANVLVNLVFFMHIEAEVAHTLRFPQTSMPMLLKPYVFLCF